MSSFRVKEVATKPFGDQKPGTSGLRKPTQTFLQEHYTENFVQAILSATSTRDPSKKSIKLVLGGDGRFFVRECLKKVILPICAANGISEVLVGQNGLLSTPAASCVIRHHKCNGGILLTASHNPGGENADFGIKYNCENGGPAPEKITQAIYEASKGISHYKTLHESFNIDLDVLGNHRFSIDGVGVFQVTVISSTEDYCKYMKELFDFPAIRALLTNEDEKVADAPEGFVLLASGMHGVMGPYIKRILCDELGLPAKRALKCDPLEDFGGHHPDPNLTYAADLVESVRADSHILMGCAFDGDGDRNMIIGRRGFFVSPCDSLAVIADHTSCIKYFQQKGVTGFARSMPTSRALDKVCEIAGIPCFEVPTGWKFFGNLMDSGMCCLCGEESFGTGSDHIREKDGMWAVLAWLSILASRRQNNQTLDLEDILQAHWSKYGRHFFTRYDYEDITADQGQQIMKKLDAFLLDQENLAREFKLTNGNSVKVIKCDDYSYEDPVDKSVSSKQGIRVFLNNGARLVYRLSGTGSSGATLRLYVDCYEQSSDQIARPSQDYLKPLIDLALMIGGVTEITGRYRPTVIT